MSVLGFVVLLVIAALAGAIGQAIVGFSRGGCLAAIAVGFIGAYLGWWIAQTFHLPTFLVVNIDGQAFPIVWAIIGSAILAGLLHLLFGFGRPYRRRPY
jgi:uncharacterized membrane protein YeaQ/YmgE (transglycosylase-associated protein family)